MIKERKELIKLLNEFAQTCKNEGIWYSMDAFSLLGTARHAGFVPWVEKVQVMMNAESYTKLKRIFFNRVVDSVTDKKLKNNLKGYFVLDAQDISTPQPFIEIRIVVPTSHKNIKKLRRPCLATRIKYGRTNTKRAINVLSDVKYEGYLTLESRHQKLDHSWIQVLSEKLEVREFAGVEVSVIKEYKTVLANWYGKDYMKAVVPKKLTTFVSPMLITKEGI